MSLTGPEVALASLSKFMADSSETNVLLAAGGKAGDELTVQRLNLTKELANDFFEIASKRIDQVSERRVLKPYDPGYKPEAHELCFADLNSIDTGQELADLVTQVGQWPMFAEKNEVISRLRFYAIVIGDVSSGCATFLRAYSPKKELSRSGLFAIAFRNGTYNKVTDKLFLFDDGVDCFIWDHFVFIFSIASFHSIFRYFEQITATASANVDLVGQQISIRNIDDFRTACLNQLPMMARLHRIVNRPYFQRLTMADIRKTAEDNGLELLFDGVGPGASIVFEGSLAKRWLILKVLDDCFLDSPMTQERYEVNSKSPLAKRSK